MQAPLGISNELPGVAEAAGPQAILGVAQADVKQQDLDVSQVLLRHDKLHLEEAGA